MDINLEPPLVLDPPAPVDEVVQPSQALAVIAKPDPSVQTELQRQAAAIVAQVAAIDPQSPDFQTKVEAIGRTGEEEIRRTAEVSNRMLERPAVQGNSNSAQSKVGKTLVELRNQVTELDPNRADLTGAKRLLKFLPGGNKVENYFHKYESAQSQLDAIVRSLRSGKDELLKDNAAIEVERRNLWNTMGKLREDNDKLEALDEAVVQSIESARNAGDVDRANALDSDLLFTIRQRRTDIQTQMAVAVQGYLALDLVRKNNIELAKGVDRAESTTLAALRTAVIVAQALTQQELVLNQITGLNESTSKMIAATSERLKVQGARIQEQASSAMLNPEDLQKAFDNIYECMDTIDSAHSQMNQNFLKTIEVFGQQLERAQPYVQRAALPQNGSQS